MNSLFSHSVGLSTRCALLLTVPTDPDMEEDLVVVDDSDLDMNGLNEKEDRSRGTPSPSSAALPTTGSDVDSSSRPEPKGKTPYTTTVKLQRGPKGYGFSVTWTHPPRYVPDDSSIRIDVYFCRTKLDFPNVENWDQLVTGEIDIGRYLVSSSTYNSQTKERIKKSIRLPSIYKSANSPTRELYNIRPPHLVSVSYMFHNIYHFFFMFSSTTSCLLLQDRAGRARLSG